MRILIVDDSRVMRSIVARTLRQAGYGGNTIEEAADGHQAWTAVQASPPDLVLSDWNMPEMTGIELLHVLRASGQDVPFGFVTSECSELMREQAESSGAQFLITKPFTAEAFSEALGGVLV